MTLAIFDIDGTLVAGPSTEKRFFLRLLRRGLIGPRRLAAFLFFNLRWLPRYGRHVAKKNKAYLAGIESARLDAEARAFVAEEVIPALYEPAVTRLREHLRAGDTAVLLSGTLQPIADELGRRLGVGEVIGSLCAEHEGRVNSAPPLRHPFGEAKRDLLGELCRRHDCSPGDVWAYGDSVYDLPLLDQVGWPVAVRPDKQLRQVADERGWATLTPGGGRGLGDAGQDTV